MSDAVRLPSVRRFVHATPGAWSLLVAAFGFEELVVYGEGDTVEHAELTWAPGGGVMLGSMPAAGTAQERTSKTGTSSIYVLTDAPDALCARATAGDRIGAYEDAQSVLARRHLLDRSTTLWATTVLATTIFRTRHTENI